MMHVRILILAKSVGLVGIMLALILEFLPPSTSLSIPNAVGLASALLIAISQALLIRHFVKTTNTIMTAAERHSLPVGVAAEAMHLRRLIVPRSYPVVVLALVTLLANPTVLGAAFPGWLRIFFLIFTILTGAYTGFIEFIALRLSDALRARLRSLLVSRSNSIPAV